MCGQEFQRKKREEEAKKRAEADKDRRPTYDKDGNLVPYSAYNHGTTTNNGYNGNDRDRDRDRDRPPLSGDLTEINTNLEELMKSLGVVTSAAAREEAAKHGTGGLLGLGEDMHENIMQITNKLQTDMMDFAALFGAPVGGTVAGAGGGGGMGGAGGGGLFVTAAQKERDDKMRDEGRREVRALFLTSLSLCQTRPSLPHTHLLSSEPCQLLTWLLLCPPPLTALHAALFSLLLPPHSFTHSPPTAVPTFY